MEQSGPTSGKIFEEYWLPVLDNCYVNLTQAIVLWKERISIEKMSPDGLVYAFALNTFWNLVSNKSLWRNLTEQPKSLKRKTKETVNKKGKKNIKKVLYSVKQEKIILPREN